MVLLSGDETRHRSPGREAEFLQGVNPRFENVPGNLLDHVRRSLHPGSPTRGAEWFSAARSVSVTRWRAKTSVSRAKLARRTRRFPQLLDPRSSLNGPDIDGPSQVFPT